MTRWPTVLGLAVALTLAGCGTTVPLAERSANGRGTGELRPDGDLASTAGSPDAGVAEFADPTAPAGTSGPSAGATTRGAGGRTLGSGRTTGSDTDPGADGSGGSEGGSTSEAAKPFKLGIITADYAGLVAAVGGGTLPDTSEFPRVLVKGINARGGMAGRAIEPVYVKIDGGAPDYSSQYQAACDTFTRDNRVEAVIAQDGINLFWSCLLKAGIPVLVASGAVNTDSKARSAYPNVFQPAGMPVDRIARGVIAQSIATGWLTTKNKVGVITSGCDWGARVYNDVVLPAMRKHGVAVERFALDCPTPGAASLGEYSSAIQSAALQFRTNGVDRVMFAADNDAAAYLFFTRNADSQQWYPGYMGGSIMGARGWNNANVVSENQARNTRGISWGKFDVDARPADTEAMRTCLELARAGGAPAALDEGTEGLYYGFCDPFMSLRIALERNGGAGGLAALQPALEGLGTSYVSPNVIDGLVELGPDRHEGARNAAFFAYLPECSCFRHTGEPQPV